MAGAVSHPIEVPIKQYVMINYHNFMPIVIITLLVLLTLGLAARRQPPSGKADKVQSFKLLSLLYFTALKRNLG